ncbi:MAG TPA: pentapeptide repeat-containing protein, partial [Candidatus Deferrimicrobium sp.]|nr:pentapeptide repeat-containing protein [Candidatus Deferrimicrobium sp.]
YVYLSEIPNSGLLAKRLWKITNDSDKTKEDAGTRLSTRSLLKPMVKKSSTEDKRWPVEFCHRSMREYFTAKKICKTIQLEDLSDAEQILRLYKLSYEILYFASQIMKNTGFNYEGNLLKLIDKSRYEDERYTDISRRLGGNAVNLLYRYKGKLPQDFNWRNLVLNDAVLDEADLSGMDFSNTYFMSANLDNVNLENTNFTKANLSLVRIEETSPVYGIAISPEEEIYAYYEDGVIRAWDYQPGKKPNAISFTENKDKKDITFFAYPGNALTVLDGNRIIFYDRAESKLEQKSIFEISQDQKIISVSEGYLLIGEERKALNMTELILYNLTSQKVVNRQYVPREAICDHIGDIGFIVSDEKNGLRITWQIDEAEPELKIPIDTGSVITCLATYPCKPPLLEYRLGIGMNNGNIEVWRIKLPQREPVKLLKNSHNSHDGKIVKDIAFIDENRVISGGFDKKVVCLSFNPGGDIICEPEEFIMRLRCKGMKVDGMEREHERKLFENFISRAT